MWKEFATASLVSQSQEWLNTVSKKKEKERKKEEARNCFNMNLINRQVETDTWQTAVTENIQNSVAIKQSKLRVYEGTESWGWEIAQRFKALAARPQALRRFPAPVSNDSQPLVTSSPDDLTPSFALCGHPHACVIRSHRRINRYKFKFRKRWMSNKRNISTSILPWFSSRLEGGHS